MARPKQPQMKGRKVPYTIRKTYRKDCYQVSNRKTKRIFAKCSTLNNAIRQDRLLRALLYNPSFIPRRN
jgi:hypothetical protein